MRLLERDAPLATLTALRTEAQTAGGRLVFVEGEAGVGKSSLLAEFRRGLPPGVRALVGACGPLATPRPLGPLLGSGGELGPAFGRLLREGAPREAVLSAFLDALRSERDPPVVLLDDLHWADEATP